VPTLTFKTLYVMLFVTHDRRELVHANVTARPSAAWVWRQLIAATPWGRMPRDLVRDRDAVYGRDFVPRARRLGVETLLAPVRAPRANAIAERLVGTLRRECLDDIVIVNEAHLRSILTEYTRYYNAERPHRALDLDTPVQQIRPATGPIRGSPVLGGLHHICRRAA
jgi:transposase InsO family protein